MAVDPINAVLEFGHKRLSELLTDRARIDKEIVGWKRVIDSVLSVSESEASDPSDVEVSAFVENETGLKTIKFTDGVRMVLSQNTSREVPISVPEIRDQLVNLGFDFAKYAQPLVPIHNTLKRLEDQGEVNPLKNDQGQTLGYKWISPIERALWNDGSDAHKALVAENIMSIRANVESATGKKEKVIERERRRILEHLSAIRKGQAKKGD
jgi:hypothetical protein